MLHAIASQIQIELRTSDLDNKNFKLLELTVLSLNLTCFLYSDCRIELDPHDLNSREDINPVLRVASLGHALHAFVNGEYVGEHTQTSSYIPVTYRSVKYVIYS